MSPPNRFLLLAMVMLCGLFFECTEAFVKGSSRVNARPVLVSSELSLGATKKEGIKKEGVKKAAAKKKVAPKAVEVETMRKADIVAAIAERMECTKSDAEKALAAVVGTVQENVVAGKKLSLAGFGTFQLKARAARKGRNPQTGEEISIKASKSPSFSAAKAFKEAANE